jgi:glycosyltransferase involved in cell wall biosynthesis
VRKARILVIGPPLDGVSGISTVVRSIVESDLALRHEVAHWCPTKSLKENQGRLRKALRGALACAMAVKVISSFGPDIVHVHVSHYGDFWRNAPLLLLARASARTTILHVHGSRFNLFYEASPRPVQRWIGRLLSLPDTVLVTSESWKRYVSQIVPGQRIEVFPNPVPAAIKGGAAISRAELGIPSDALVVLFVGNERKADAVRKGLSDILEIASGVRRRVPQVFFVFAGPPAAAVAQDGPQVGLIFLGPVSPTRMAGLYAAADLFVLPSYAEGLPCAMIEAMAAGLPVVASTAGGIPEAIEEGVNGFLVRPGDKIALEDKLVLLLERPDLRSRMGANNQTKAQERFNRTKSLGLLEGIYNDLLVQR